MPKVIWTEKCLQRIEEICEYIELDSVSSSNKFAIEIFSKEELIRRNPRIGKIVPDYEIEEYRQIIVGNYRLVYQFDEISIQMITVRHCKQEKVIED